MADKVIVLPPAPVVPPVKKRGFKASLSRVWAGVRAGLSSPTAVTAEKSLAALVVTRALLALGAGGALIDGIVRVINGL